MAIMARQRASVRRSREKGGGLFFPQPFEPATPFACGSHVTSRDSPKWRVGSKVACSRLRDSGGKSFSNKKCEKRAGVYYLRAWHRLARRLKHVHHFSSI